MPDIIQLLPDNIANQIAAGEVIQRPSSAVKELLENAVDAGADEIRLVVKDAGKALIQVIDNGKGMSETDARMAFERHATSKIQQIEDLFSIRTMGFRGEALASIAAVAQVELKTRRKEDKTGTYIEVANSIVKKQEPIATPAGSNIAMKNLFFNIPARRNFLKSNAAELRHIVDEFIRVSMAFPELFFSLTSNEQEVFHLEKGTLKQRVIQILGNNYKSKLVPVNEESDYMNIYGFVGKPETAKKTRGDQYFFVNKRFIKSPYLNHALMNAFDAMIPKDSFPMYALFIDLDPALLDINVHPTKQEIKFEDEKIIYAFIQSAVKHALAQFSITPALDFELDPSIQQLDAVTKPFTEESKHTVHRSSLYQGFTQKNQAHLIDMDKKSDLKLWSKAAEDFYGAEKPITSPPNGELQQELYKAMEKNNFPFFDHFLQLNLTYIVVENEAGHWLVHQQNAHERILYERFAKAINGSPIATQKSLFPLALEFTASDVVLIKELLPDLHQLGYLLEPFGKHTYVVQGIPADTAPGNEKTTLEKMLEQFKHFSNDLKYPKREKLIRSMAMQRSLKPGSPLSHTEIKILLQDLFNCDTPNITPAGKPTYIEYQNETLKRAFGR